MVNLNSKRADMKMLARVKLELGFGHRSETAVVLKPSKGMPTS
jgi:hypothetical protein